jgi:hypothetical protein
MTPREIKELIINVIRKYDLEYYIEHAPKYQSFEMNIAFGYESRKSNNIINITKKCLAEQKIIDHITSMINLNNYTILEDFYTEYVKIDIMNDLYDDNKLSNKLYPFIIYMYMQIFRDSSLNAMNVVDWVKKTSAT